MTPDPDRIRAALSRPGLPSSDFDLNPETVLPEGRRLRPAGVLVAITGTDDALSVLLTKRSSALKHHPGQIAFPGGKQNDDDQDVTAAALREAEEEVGLPRTDAEILGTLPSHETVTGFQVTPVIARVTTEFEIRPQPGEVDEVFHVPLAHVLNPDSFRIEGRRWRGQMRLYYTVPYGPYYIWGATARMLRAWTEQMKT